MIRNLAIAALVSLFAVSFLRAEEARLSGSVLSVTDGDTIKVRVAGSNVRVRLIGVDAPESRENDRARRMSAKSGRDLAVILENGRRAAAFLASLVKKGARVELELDSERTDRYGRTLAYVYREDGSMLNELLLAGGYASLYTVPPNVRHVDRLRRAFDQARRAGEGLWGTEGASRKGDS